MCVWCTSSRKSAALLYYWLYRCYSWLLCLLLLQEKIISKIIALWFDGIQPWNSRYCQATSRRGSECFPLGAEPTMSSTHIARATRIRWFNYTIRTNFVFYPTVGWLYIIFVLTWDHKLPFTSCAVRVTSERFSLFSTKTSSTSSSSYAYRIMLNDSS